MFGKITELDLVSIKSYLRVDHTEDDQFLNMALIAAKSYIQNHLNQKFTDFVELPDEFTIAALALIAHWYEKREITGNSDKQTPFLFTQLLDMHKKFPMGVVPE